MARPLRIQYPDAVYHVTCRGNEKQNIYRDDEDRKRFIQVLNQSVNINGVKLHSYVLMNNHFHLLVETPKANLSEFMRHFNIMYIGYFNRRHNRVGHLYQGRYKAIIVDRDEYLSVLSRYIHLNPVRIKGLEKAEPKEKFKRLVGYPWSSLRGYLYKRKKEHFIDYTLVLGEYGGDTERARKLYRKALVEEMIQGKELHDQVVGQTVLGGDAFVGWLKATFLAEEKDREAPAHQAIKQYSTHREIADVLFDRTGKTIEHIKNEKGPLRQIAMDLLHRHAGMTNPEIGRLFGVDYSSVSQERKRLRGRLENDGKLFKLHRDFELEMTRVKKRPQWSLMKTDNRKERRHEIPDPCRKYLTFTVTHEKELVTAVIGNFSRNGILFECSRQFTAGDRAECCLRLNKATPREVTFGIEVRYCYENKGAFITGAFVHAISQDKWFDAFEQLFDMIVTRQGTS